MRASGEQPGKIASKARHETSAHELMARHSKAYLWTHAERDMPCHCGVMELLGPRSPYRCPIELPHSKLREQPRNSIGVDGGQGRILLDLNGEHLCSWRVVSSFFGSTSATRESHFGRDLRCELTTPGHPAQALQAQLEQESRGAVGEEGGRSSLRRGDDGLDAGRESCPTCISIRCSEARCTSGRPRCRGTRTGAAIRPRTAAVVGWREELPQMGCRFGETPNPINQKIKTLSLTLIADQSNRVARDVRDAGAGCGACREDPSVPAPPTASPHRPPVVPTSG